MTPDQRRYEDVLTAEARAAAAASLAAIDLRADALLEHRRREREFHEQRQRRERSITTAVLMGAIMGLAFWTLAIIALAFLADALVR